MATISVPEAVMVPDVVIGPPLNDSPVVPPETSTDVTVPEPEVAAQVNADPFHCKTVPETLGAVINDVAPDPVW